MSTGDSKIKAIASSTLQSLAVGSFAVGSLPVVSSNAFKPSDAHRRAKTAFWSHYFSQGTNPPAEITMAMAAQYSGFSLEVQIWWEQLGFPEWFSNGEEFRQRVEYLSNAALDVLQELLHDPVAKMGDRLQAAKMALEIAAKFPKAAPKEQYLDTAIGEMGVKELEDFINRKMRNVTPSPPELVDVSPLTLDTLIPVDIEPKKG